MTFLGHVTSPVTWPFGRPMFPICFFRQFFRYDAPFSHNT